MFNKKDRRVVEVTIEFNISAINQWLKAGGEFEDIDKIDRDWEDSMIQKYIIDMLPIGGESNAYYHRGKGVISQNISGIDFLENAKTDVQRFVEKEAKVRLLSWDMWRGCFALEVNRNLILLTPPLTEVVELETTGKLSNPGSPKDEDAKIKVPISFDDKNNPTGFMEVWRGSHSDRSLGYGNALGHVSFSILNFEVEY